MRMGVPVGIARAMLAVGWAATGTATISPRSARVAGAQVDTSASSCGTSLQTAKPETAKRRDAGSSGAVCEAPVGTHKNPRGEIQKIARTNLRPIGLTFNRESARVAGADAN